MMNKRDLCEGEKEEISGLGPMILNLRKIMESRGTKQQRQFLQRKDAEEYIKICREESHPVIKQARKAHHFLRWVIKILALD